MTQLAARASLIGGAMLAATACATDGGDANLRQLERATQRETRRDVVFDPNSLERQSREHRLTNGTIRSPRSLIR